MSLIGHSIGNYVIKSKLGEGGMGAVYLGEHPLIGKRVAVKVLLDSLAAQPEVVRRFFHEAKAVNEIGHPNIVDIVDFGRAPSETGGELVYLIMEFLDGDSLAGRLRTGLRLADVIEIMQQCCSALSASHQKGIVHRDLKPENIYLCRRGANNNFVKVLDFGIAKLTADTTKTNQTRTGMVMGTPHFMSPEQCEGSKQIDHRSDIYSLGVVMFQLLTGQVPFPGEGFGEVIVAHMMKPVPLPSSLRPGVPPELEAIVLRALEKDPARRFQTMDEFAMALSDPAWHHAGYARSASASMPTVTADSVTRVPTGRGMVPHVTTLSGAASEISRPIQRVRRSRAGLWIGLVALLAVGGGGAYFALQGRLSTASPATSAAQPQPEKTEPQQAEPVAVPAPEAPQKIKLSFASSPSGARVTRADGTVLGTTPIAVEVEKGSPAFDVAFSLEGYEQQRRSITTALTQDVLVTLTPHAVAAPTAVAAPAPAVAHTHHAHHATPSGKSAAAPLDDGGLLHSSLLDDPAPTKKK